MRKFNTDKPFNIKQLLVYTVSFFIIHFPLNYYINSFGENEKSITASLIGSAFFSVIMGLVFGYFARPKYGKLDEVISKKLDQDENILLESIAGIKQGFIVFPGKLYLTDQRFLLAKHKSFQNPETKIIKRSQVISIQPVKRFNLFDNGITIEVQSGEKYNFNIDNRDEVLSAFQSKMDLA